MLWFIFTQEPQQTLNLRPFSARIAVAMALCLCLIPTSLISVSVILPAPECVFFFQRKQLIFHTAAAEGKNPPIQQYLKCGFMLLWQLIFLKWFKGVNTSKMPALSHSAVATWSWTCSALNNPISCGQLLTADLVENGRDEGYFLLHYFPGNFTLHFISFHIPQRAETSGEERVAGQMCSTA